MDLPTELIDYIFILLSCKSTLSSCSLVCSSWTDLAHRHLFSKFVYTRPESETADATPLLRFFQDAPSVAKHVKILDLKSGFGSGTVARCSCYPEVFSGLMMALPNVEHVILGSIDPPWPGSNIGDEEDDGDGEDGIDERSKPFVRSWKHLKSLEIDQNWIDGENPYNTVLQVLQPIESLHTLRVSGGFFSCVNLSNVALRKYCSTLAAPSHLGIQEFVWNIDILPAIVLLEPLRRAPPCTLRHFDMSYSANPNMIWVVQDFLNEVGAGLETLAITLRGTHSEWVYLLVLSLL